MSSAVPMTLPQAIVRGTGRRTQLTIADKKLLDILEQHDGHADVGTLLDNGLGKYHDSVSIQKQLTQLCKRELVMRSGVTVLLL